MVSMIFQGRRGCNISGEVILVLSGSLGSSGKRWRGGGLPRLLASSVSFMSDLFIFVFDNHNKCMALSHPKSAPRQLQEDFNLLQINLVLSEIARLEAEVLVYT